jgi:glutaredoxin
MYYLFIVVLQNCPYSESAVELLEKNKINFKSLKITSLDKEKYKTDEIHTFPQIYLKKTKNNDTLLLGGYSDLKNFFDNFIDKKYDEKKVINFQKKYLLWNKHSVLRLIELVNLKRIE